MKTFTYTIKDENGIHARPAGLLVKCAQGLHSTVNITLNGKTADSKRLFSVMSLNAKQNDTVTFQVEGKDELADCTALKAFCQSNL
ncbi:MAG: HPr family phosphocarrier protein [Ruminococcaceae bacterium]|jgi:Phosphotransferase System HPr (HPr) Family|nr:HPr family phosphocarrier protein [Oscillospiraceae bacterium]